MNRLSVLRITIVSSILFFSIAEGIIYEFGANEFLESHLLASFFGAGVILLLFISEMFVQRLVIPILIFMFLFNLVSNTQKFVKKVETNKTLEEVQAEFCKLRNWKNCHIQNMGNIGQPENKPRAVSWSEAHRIKWKWDEWKAYSKELPEIQSKWETDKKELNKANKEFLGLKPMTISQSDKFWKSFEFMTTNEVFWLGLRLIFGFFISIILITLFQKAKIVFAEIEVVERKVDSIEVEAIKKIAVLKNQDRHWKYRNPERVLDLFPGFPREEGVELINRTRAAFKPQNTAETAMRSNAVKCGQSAAYLTASLKMLSNYHMKFKN